MPFAAQSHIHRASVIDRDYGRSQPANLTEPDGETMPMFPRALVACISDGHAPSLEELASMTQRMWRDVYRSNGGAGDFYRSRAMARLALSGTGAEGVL